MGPLTNEIKQLEAVLNNVRKEQERASKALGDANAAVADAQGRRDLSREDFDRTKRITRALESALAALKEVDES